VLEFLAEEVSLGTYVNLMDQYRPCYRADEYPELDRRITRAEYEAALAAAARYGIARLDHRAPRQRRF
jgi:putative pyruvate formate lyase activating enzyme